MASPASTDGRDWSAKVERKHSRSPKTSPRVPKEARSRWMRRGAETRIRTKGAATEIVVLAMEIEPCGTGENPRVP